MSTNLIFVRLREGSLPALICTCVGGEHGLASEADHLVVLQLHPRQVGQRLETLRRNFGNFVVVEVNIFESVQQRAVAKLGNLVETGIESLKTEASAEGVVVANLVNFIVMDIQPLK